MFYTSFTEMQRQLWLNIHKWISGRNDKHCDTIKTSRPAQHSYLNSVQVLGKTVLSVQFQTRRIWESSLVLLYYNSAWYHK